MRFVVCALLLSLAITGRADTLSGEEVLDALEVPENDRQQLEDGGVIAYDGQQYEGTERELAADAIVLLDKSLDEIVEEMREVGSIIPIKYLVEYQEITSLDDFNGVALTNDEIKEADKLLRAKRSKNLNLSDEEIALLNKAGSEAKRLNTAGRVAAASEALRQILIGRYQSYQESGLKGIPVYQRSKRKAISIGDELTFTTETFAPFEPEFPEYYRLMHDFPEGADCCEHIFRWMKVELRDRPSFALTHTFIQRTDDFLLITERHYYVTHTINSVQVTVSWIPYADGTYMGLAVSASTDVLETMMGKMLRGVGRDKARDLVTDVLVEFRQEMEEGIQEAEDAAE